MLLPSFGGKLYGYSEMSVTGLGGMEGDDETIYLYLFVVNSHLVAMLCMVEVSVLEGWLRPRANEIAQNSQWWQNRSHLYSPFDSLGAYKLLAIKSLNGLMLCFICKHRSVITEVHPKLELRMSLCDVYVVACFCRGLDFGSQSWFCRGSWQRGFGGRWCIIVIACV